MNQHNFPRIRVQGSPIERGRQYGEAAASRIQRNIEIYQEMFAHYAGWDWNKARAHAKLFEPAIAEFRPRYLDEMRGIAEGANVDYDDILALNVRTEIRNFAIAKNAPGECSSFVALPPVTEDGHTIIGQNWDWVVPVSETVIVLEVETSDMPNFMTVVEAGLLAKTGMNAAGIGMTTNALHSDLESNAVAGIPYHMILRALLESESFSDAIAVINGHKRASSANYTVAHRDGEFFNVETAPGDYTRAYIHFPDDNFYAHTNHYLSPQIDFNDVGVWHGPGSLVRYHRLNRFLRSHEGKFTVDDLQKALSDHVNFPDAVCSHPDPRNPVQEHFQTITSLIMDLNSATIWLAEGNPCTEKYIKSEYKNLFNS